MRGISSVIQTGSIAAIKKLVGPNRAFTLLIWKPLSSRNMDLLKLSLPLVFFLFLGNIAAIVKGKSVIIT